MTGNSLGEDFMPMPVDDLGDFLFRARRYPLAGDRNCSDQFLLPHVFGIRHLELVGLVERGWLEGCTDCRLIQGNFRPYGLRHGDLRRSYRTQADQKKRPSQIVLTITHSS